MLSLDLDPENGRQRRRQDGVALKQLLFLQRPDSLLIAGYRLQSGPGRSGQRLWGLLTAGWRGAPQTEESTPSSPLCRWL